jgi:hypothetical protein
MSAMPCYRQSSHESTHLLPGHLYATCRSCARCILMSDPSRKREAKLFALARNSPRTTGSLDELSSIRPSAGRGGITESPSRNGRDASGQGQRRAAVSMSSCCTGAGRSLKRRRGRSSTVRLRAVSHRACSSSSSESSAGKRRYSVKSSASTR